MRDPARIQRICNLLQEVWAANPDMRLGQLLINVGGAQVERNVWFVEDAEWEQALYRAAKEGW